MRPSLVLAAAFALGAAPAAAQLAPAAPAAPPARVGLLVGLNSSTISGFEDLSGEELLGGETGRRTGVLAGVYAVLPFGSSGLAFRPELLYSTKGVRQTVSFFDEFPTSLHAARTRTTPAAPRAVTALPTIAQQAEFDLTLKLDYLEVPLLLQFAPARSGGVRPQLYAGPALAVRIRCSISAGFDGSSESGECSGAEDGGAEEDLPLKRFDVGALVGGAVAFDVGGRALTVGVRYTHGLTNIADDDTDVGTYRHRTVGVYGSLELPLGRRSR